MSLAKPAIDTIGVLNSCEKLLMKSERSISVFSSSLAVLLMLSARSCMPGICLYGPLNWSLAE